MTRAILKSGREKALLRRHPWIFSGAVLRLDGKPRTGDAVRVEAHDGRFLGWGIYSGSSQISVRVWSFIEDAPIDAELITRKIATAIQRRAPVLENFTALRLVNAEADGLPGVICDRYGNHLVVQLSSAGADSWREIIVDALIQHSGVENVYERSDSEVLELEGLTARVGAVRGSMPNVTLPIEEAGFRFEVNIVDGHKTGFYLDQRDNRALLRQLAAVDSLLDCFCYTGGFTVNALAGGAKHITAIDSSADALALAVKHVSDNGFDPGPVEWIEDDVFKRLRKLRDQARQFDLIVLDPPKFAPTAAYAERAARGYKDINLLAFKLLNPGGKLLTFSCSGGIDRALFQKIIAGAALDAGVDARLLRHLSAGIDHPVAMNFPEGDYLKGLICQVA
ncbi:MAG: methyltransferase domain-containing protein [Gammaproteobacteria bacterium]|nr:methyltransferase domain-containing protein [Gammaproteobacteria bacterium]